MNKTIALYLLNNLLDRVEFGPNGKLKNNNLTQMEIDALRFVLNSEVGIDDDPTPTGDDETGGDDETDGDDETGGDCGTGGNDGTSDEDKPDVASILNLDSLKPENEFDEQNSKVTLCMDFGTAMSKAFAMRDGLPVELALGARAGSATGGYLVDSSLFITNEGLIFFGPQAVKKSMHAEVENRARADSLKARLSMGSMANISEIRVDKRVNPTQIPFTEGDLITLYLSYLTDLVSSELESQNCSRYTVRRFARPCWDEERNAWAEPQMKKMLAISQILADTFHGRWQDGLSVDVAKKALIDVNKTVRIPEYLIARSIEEPVAAAAALVVDPDEAQREIVIVVDVGAGTTDFGVFLLQNNPNKEVLKTRLIDKTVTYLPQAGNRVDDLLKFFVLKEGNIDHQAEEGNQALQSLSGVIRTYKETLFREGIVEIGVNGINILVDKEEFINSRGVGEFTRLLKDKFVAVLSSLGGGYIDFLAKYGLNVVLTGGGAEMPMLSSLAAGVIEVNGKKIMRKASPMVPEWIEEKYPQFASQYLQLAVSIGGAARVLPDAAKAPVDFPPTGQ